MASLYWITAAVTLLTSVFLYRNCGVDDNSDTPLVETDCGTVLGEKDSTHHVYVFKVRIKSSANSGQGIMEFFLNEVKLSLNSVNWSNH